MTLFELMQLREEEITKNNIQIFNTRLNKSEAEISHVYRDVCIDFIDNCNIFINGSQICEVFKYLDGQNWECMIDVTHDADRNLPKISFGWINKDVQVYQYVFTIWSEDVDLARACIAKLNWIDVDSLGSRRVPVGNLSSERLDKQDSIRDIFGLKNVFYNENGRGAQHAVEAFIEIAKHIECNFEHPELSEIDWSFLTKCSASDKE